MQSVVSTAVQYGNAARPNVALGGIGTTAAASLANVAAGMLSATSTDAVNGSQLFSLAAIISSLDDLVTNILAGAVAKISA